MKSTLCMLTALTLAACGSGPSTNDDDTDSAVDQNCSIDVELGADVPEFDSITCGTSSQEGSYFLSVEPLNWWLGIGVYGDAPVVGETYSGLDGWIELKTDDDDFFIGDCTVDIDSVAVEDEARNDLRVDGSATCGEMLAESFNTDQGTVAVNSGVTFSLVYLSAP